MMMFDTDVLIWAQRGNKKATKVINETEPRKISIITLMKLLQCAHNKTQHVIIKDFIHQFNFSILALTENIGHRALIYIEEYGLKSGLRLGDALIAATANEYDLSLITSNKKHYKDIRNLTQQHFRPH